MENIESYFWLVPVCSLAALGFAYLFFKQMIKQSEGTSKMKQIAQYVREGAMAYIKSQYRVVA